jgi:DNA-directed RNA polymerase subunit omega
MPLASESGATLSTGGKMTPVEGLDSNFRYVVMAARRARQLQNGSQPLIDSRSNKACRVAQEEIAAGKVKAAEPLLETAEVIDLDGPQDVEL